MRIAAFLLAGIALISLAFRGAEPKYPPSNFADSTGAKLFRTYCSACHKDSAAGLAPAFFMLKYMSSRSIYASLKSGKMRQQGSALTDAQQRNIAAWLTGYPVTTSSSLPDSAYTKFSLAGNAHRYDHWGWGNNYEGTGFTPSSQTSITPENVRQLKLKWAFGQEDAVVVRSKPALVGDWLIFGTQFGEVYALNKNTGKIGWKFTASNAIRGGIQIIKKENDYTVIFADYGTSVYALNLATGKLKWSARAGFEPLSAVTGTVVAYNNKIYVPLSTVEISAVANNDYECCKSSGGVVALDANTGKIVWKYRNTAPAKFIGKNKKGKAFFGPSGAPVWCSPTVDTKRKLLYFGSGQNYSRPATQTSDAIQALNLETGKRVWVFQATSEDAYNTACPYLINCPDSSGPDLDFGMAPMIVKLKSGSDILVAGQKSGVVWGINPSTGKMVWKTRVGKGGALGGIHWGMAASGDTVFAANADNGLALDKSDTSIKATPGIFALNANTGEIIWKAPPPCPGKGYCFNFNSAAPLALPGLVIAGTTNGQIRAYDSRTGNLLWEYETIRDYETANGVKGRGGSIDGPAPFVAGNMLFVNSGYGMFGQKAGNVLLAFQVD